MHWCDKFNCACMAYNDGKNCDICIVGELVESGLIPPTNCFGEKMGYQNEDN